MNHTNGLVVVVIVAAVGTLNAACHEKSESECVVESCTIAVRHLYSDMLPMQAFRQDVSDGGMLHENRVECGTVSVPLDRPSMNVELSLRLRLRERCHWMFPDTYVACDSVQMIQERAGQYEIDLEGVKRGPIGVLLRTETENILVLGTSEEELGDRIDKYTPAGSSPTSGQWWIVGFVFSSATEYEPIPTLVRKSGEGGRE